MNKQSAAPLLCAATAVFRDCVSIAAAVYMNDCWMIPGTCEKASPRLLSALDRALLCRYEAIYRPRRPGTCRTGCMDIRQCQTRQVKRGAAQQSQDVEFYKIYTFCIGTTSGGSRAPLSYCPSNAITYAPPQAKPAKLALQLPLQVRSQLGARGTCCRGSHQAHPLMRHGDGLQLSNRAEHSCMAAMQCAADTWHT